MFPLLHNVKNTEYVFFFEKGAKVEDVKLYFIMFLIFIFLNSDKVEYLNKTKLNSFIYTLENTVPGNLTVFCSRLWSKSCRILDEGKWPCWVTVHTKGPGGRGSHSWEGRRSHGWCATPSSACGLPVLATPLAFLRITALVKYITPYHVDKD